VQPVPVVELLVAVLVLLFANVAGWTNSTALFDTVTQSVSVKALD